MKLDAKAVGRRIRRLRLAKGMTQVQLARKIGSHFNAIAHWERGNCVPRLIFRPKIARALGSQPEQIFYDRTDRLAAARDRALEKSISILESDEASAAAINAATNALLRTEAVGAEKTVSALEEELRQRMRTARDELRKRLARLEAEEA